MAESRCRRPPKSTNAPTPAPAPAQADDDQNDKGEQNAADADAADDTAVAIAVVEGRNPPEQHDEPDLPPLLRRGLDGLRAAIRETAKYNQDTLQNRWHHLYTLFARSSLDRSFDHNSQHSDVDVDASDDDAAEPGSAAGENQQVRPSSWPTWIQDQLRPDELELVLRAVFASYTALTTPDTFRRQKRAATLYQTTVWHFFLYFGPTIANSPKAIRTLISLHTKNPHASLDDVYAHYLAVLSSHSAANPQSPRYRPNSPRSCETTRASAKPSETTTIRQPQPFYRGRLGDILKAVNSMSQQPHSSTEASAERQDADPASAETSMPDPNFGAISDGSSGDRNERAPFPQSSANGAATPTTIDNRHTSPAERASRGIHDGDVEDQNEDKTTAPLRHSRPLGITIRPHLSPVEEYSTNHDLPIGEMSFDFDEPMSPLAADWRSPVSSPEIEVARRHAPPSFESSLGMVDSPLGHIDATEMTASPRTRQLVSTCRHGSPSPPRKRPPDHGTFTNENTGKSPRKSIDAGFHDLNQAPWTRRSTKRQKRFNETPRASSTQARHAPGWREASPLPVEDEADEEHGARSQLQFYHELRTALKTFDGHNWLNDTAVNALLSRLESRSIGIVPSHFLLAAHRRQLPPKARHMAGKEVLLFPVHQSGSHWVLCRWIQHIHRMEWFDSLGGLSAATLEGPEGLAARVISFLAWIYGLENLECDIVVCKAAVQPNGHDCGLYAINNARILKELGDTPWLPDSELGYIHDLPQLRVEHQGQLLSSVDSAPPGYLGLVPPGCQTGPAHRARWLATVRQSLVSSSHPLPSINLLGQAVTRLNAAVAAAATNVALAQQRHLQAFRRAVDASDAQATQRARAALQRQCVVSLQAFVDAHRQMMMDAHVVEDSSNNAVTKNNGDTTTVGGEGSAVHWAVISGLATSAAAVLPPATADVEESGPGRDASKRGHSSSSSPSPSAWAESVVWLLVLRKAGLALSRAKVRAAQVDGELERLNSLVL